MCDDKSEHLHQWTYVPGRVKDLDLKELLKEFQRAEAESDTDIEQEAEERDISEILNESFCDSNSAKNLPTVIASPSHNFREPTEPVENGIERYHLQTISEDDISYISSSSNIPVTNNNENAYAGLGADSTSKGTKSNASFDLDLSTLPLTTPVKTFDNKQYSSSKVLFRTPITKLLPYALSCPRKPALENTPQICNYIGKETTSLKKDQPQDSDYEFDKIFVNSKLYVIIGTLGKGGSSDVFCCFNTTEQLLVALKVVSLSDAKTATSYINEVQLLKSLQTCERIIKIYDYEIRSDKILMVMEKGGEDLSTILKQLSAKKSHIPQYMLFFYWMEMLHAVKEIHDNGVIHADIKPANFLRADGGIKLIDFGIASRVSKNMSCVFKSNREGSCNYVSPEALSHQYNGNMDSPNYGKCRYQIHFKSDVWSLGCILYELVYKRSPFHHIKQLTDKLSAIQNPNFEISYPEAKWTSPRIISTIKKCLQYNVMDRPTVGELMAEYKQLL